MDKSLIFAAIEAILFAAGEPVQISVLAKALETDAVLAAEYTEELSVHYETEKRGLRIVRMENCFQMITSSGVFSYVKAALELNTSGALSQAAVETLAIVAYKQPVTRSEIEQIRGVHSSSSLDLLIAKGLIRDSGKLDLPGRPAGFKTTEEFLKLMKIESLDKLPSFEYFKAGIEDALEAKEEAIVIE